MTPADKLKEIEASLFGPGTEEIRWLIARVKRLTEDLQFVADKYWHLSQPCRACELDEELEPCTCFDKDIVQDMQECGERARKALEGDE